MNPVSHVLCLHAGQCRYAKRGFDNMVPKYPAEAMYFIEHNYQTNRAFL